MKLNFNIKGEHAEDLSYILYKHPKTVFNKKYKYSLMTGLYTKYIPGEIEFDFSTEQNNYDILNSCRNNKNAKLAIDITDYINEKEFAVNSFFTACFKKSFSNILNRNITEANKEYEYLLDKKFEITAEFCPVSTKFSIKTIAKIFNSIGYKIEIESYNCNKSCFKRKNNVYIIKLHHEDLDICTFFRQIFILLPVLDDYRHHYVMDVHAKILKEYGEGWLNTHPLKNVITKIFLQYYKPEENIWDDNNIEKTINSSEEIKDEPKKKKLSEYRMEYLLDKIKQLNSKHVVDFGCGEGSLARNILINNLNVNKLDCYDVRTNTLELAERKIKKIFNMFTLDKSEINNDIYKNIDINDLHLRQDNINFNFGSLYYQMKDINNCELLILSEIIEHLDYLDLAMENVFENIQPENLIITTPNRECNSLYGYKNGSLRFFDHRFEFTAAEFMNWANQLAKQYNYTTEFTGIGERHEFLGYPTLSCLFTKGEKAR